MAHNRLALLLLLLSLLSISGGGTAESRPPFHRRSRARAFVEAQCRATQYPKQCVEVLSSFVNSSSESPRGLAQIALRVSLVRARYARAYATQVASQLKRTRARRDCQAVKDCLDQITDGVSQITQSLKELGRMGLDGEEAFVWHESNVNSWVSAALTDAMTCMDGISGKAMGGKAKATIRAKVLNLAQHTSNALALFNRFAARHRASRRTRTKP